MGSVWGRCSAASPQFKQKQEVRISSHTKLGLKQVLKAKTANMKHKTTAIDEMMNKKLKNNTIGMDL